MSISQPHNLELKAYSRRQLTQGFARQQLEFLAHSHEEVFRPERCDVGEPLHEKFDPDHLDEPIRWLSAAGGEFTFKRLHSIRLLGYLKNHVPRDIWIRHTPRGPREQLLPTCEPIFLTTWTIWIDRVIEKKRGITFLRQFLIDLCRVAHADYAFLTTIADYDLKNCLITIGSDRSTTEEFVGDRPEHGIPGLYWMNWFGSLYVDWFSKTKLRQIKCTHVELFDDGIFLQFGEKSTDSMDDSVLQLQRAAMNLLNPAAFFDISNPTRLLETPDFSIHQPA